MSITNTLPIRFPKDLAPQLIVVVDSEEEFDWSSEPNRDEANVSAMTQIDRIQEIFDAYEIKPCYLVDYPVVDKLEGYSPLQNIFNKGKCEIGAHLHPWVNPPFNETVNHHNMYPCNLPKNLEMQKLKKLTDKIEGVFKQRPVIYKAGRYGFGANTTQILKELGYQIDLSFCPPVDYTKDGGPDYSRTHAEPCWLDYDKSLLEIPVTGGFVGIAGRFSRHIYHIADQLTQFKLPAILARMGIVDRLMLSPEGFTAHEHIKLTQFLYSQGVRTFTWSFHSPSLVPGFTPYVRNEKDLQQFLDSFQQYFDFFFQQLKGTASTPIQLKTQMEQL